MNLIEAADELEFVPKDQLAGFVNDPNSRYPSYLVLSEIQRRTQLEKAYNAEQAAMEPNTTVAEEVVANFTGEGLASAMPPSGAPPTGMPQTNMPPKGLQMGASPLPQENVIPSGIQGMAEGGRTGYRSGDLTNLKYLSEPKLNNYQITDVMNNSNLNNDPNFQALDEKGLGFNVDDIISGARAIKDSDLYPKLNAEYDRTATDAAKKALSEDYARYEDEEENIRKIPDEIKNFGLSQVDFSAPTKEERQRDLNVSALAGMAKIFGSATNLGEAGAGLGALATDIQGIRKAARKEDRDLQMQQRTASAQDFEIATKKDTIRADREKVVQANRKEMTGIDRTIALLTQAKDKATYEGAIKKFEMKWEGSKEALKVVTDGMRDRVLLENAKASGIRSLVTLVSELVREKQDLNSSSSLDLPRIRQINAELEGITNSIYRSKNIQIPKGEPFTGATKDQQ